MATRKTTDTTGAGSGSAGRSRTPARAQGGQKSNGPTAGGAAGATGAAKTGGRTAGGAAKKATKAPTRAAAKTPAKAAGAARPGSRSGARGKPDLRSDLREFVGQHPQGWGHDEWLGLVGRLRERGHDVSNQDQIGSSLERERLLANLEGMEGVGPQKVKALVDRFGSVWSLRHASTDEIAGAARIERSVAERIQQTLR